MKNIKRYQMYANHAHEVDADEQADGAWVKYEDIKHLLRQNEPMAILPCCKRADGLHDFRHEVCDCGASREDTFENPEAGV